MIYGVLRAADFSLQALLRHERELRAQPVAVMSDESRKATVFQCNEHAARAGVEEGMTAPRALARCGSLQIRHRHPERERALREILLTAALSFSPWIEETAAGLWTIDLAGADRAELPEKSRAVAERLRQMEVSAQIGLASAPRLAAYAAQCAQPVLEVTDEAAFVEPLPLALAGPGPRLAAILDRWGVVTIGGLISLSRQDVAQRLGAEGAALWDRAAGREERPLRLVRETPQFCEQLDFEYEVQTLEPLLFILKRFLDQLALRLEMAHAVAAEVAMTLRLAGDRAPYHRLFKAPEPTRDSLILFRMLHTHLESLRTEAAVTGLRIEMTPGRPAHHQGGLFDIGLRDPPRFAETLARLGALVGGDRVGRPERLDTHRPDAFIMKPPELRPHHPADGIALPPPVGLPLRRFRPALEAEVRTQENNRPRALACEHVRGEVRQCLGPWRGSGDWWDRQSWSREEWDVELMRGGLYRLARRHDEQWFLEGVYG